MKGTPDFPQCGFSAQTVAALRAVGAQFKHVNIFEEPELREALKRYSNWPTYPQLYVNGELVGGCDIALEMYHSGELKKLLAGQRRRRRLTLRRAVRPPRYPAAVRPLQSPDGTVPAELARPLGGGLIAWSAAGCRQDRRPRRVRSAS